MNLPNAMIEDASWLWDMWNHLQETGWLTSSFDVSSACVELNCQQRSQAFF
jgi:hypothetical protein